MQAQKKSDVPASVRAYFSRIGRRGGETVTEKKREHLARIRKLPRKARAEKG